MTCYTPAELAERWKCSASHVRKMIDNGELPAFRIGGKLLRINHSDLEAYERQQGTVSGTKPGGSHQEKASRRSEALAPVSVLVSRDTKGDDLWRGARLRCPTDRRSQTRRRYGSSTRRPWHIREVA